MKLDQSYRIVLASGCPAGERYAANMLRDYVKKCTGMTYPVAEENEPSQENEIALGLARGAFCDEALGEEGFRVYVSDRRVYLAARAARGTIYAVLWFLENYLGCRFFARDCEKIVSTDRIRLPDHLDYSYKPAFELRDLLFASENDTDIAVKHRLNRRHFNIRSLPQQVGGGKEFAGFFAHTLGELAETGYGVTGPCLSSEDTFRTVMKNVYARLAERPDAEYVCIAENDDYLYCKCDKCEATAREEESRMGVLMRFVNRVAETLAPDYPNVKVVTYAYQHTRKPPKLVRPRENVCVMVCSIDCCFSHSFAQCATPAPSPWMELDPDRNFQKDLADWSQICDNVYVWDYVIDFYHYLMFFPNFNHLRDNMNFLASYGVKGVFVQGLSNLERDMGYGEFGALRAYVLSKLAYRPDMDANEFAMHYLEFLEAYYGEGFQYIRTYIDEACALASGSHVGIYKHPLEIIPPEKGGEYLRMAHRCFDNAERLADRTQKKRLALARLQVTYYEQIFRYEAEYKKGSEAQRKRYVNRNKAFYRALAENNVYMNPDSKLPREPDMTQSPDLWHKLG